MRCDRVRATRKHGKATGPDDLLIEYVTMLAKQDIRYVVEAMNQVLQQEELPEIWTKSRMVQIYKGKGDIKVKVCWTAQIALYTFPPLAGLFIPTPTRLLLEAF